MDIHYNVDRAWATFTFVFSPFLSSFKNCQEEWFGIYIYIYTVIWPSAGTLR